MTLDPITRFIGPIPELPEAPAYGSGEWHQMCAPDGPRLEWADYAPVRKLPCTWGPWEVGEIPCLFGGDQAGRDAVAPGWGYDEAGEQWWSHSGATPLHRIDGQWWVGAPDRPSWRVVGLLREAGRALQGARKDEISYALVHPSSRPGDPDLALWCAGVRGDDFAPEGAGEDWYNETDAALDRWAYECGQAVAAGCRRPDRPKTRPTFGRREVLVDDDLDIVRREDWPNDHLTTYSVRGAFGHDE